MTGPIRSGVTTEGPPGGTIKGVSTRILTVEDDERIRTAVKLALEDEGWDVVEAGTGEDALEAFHSEPADVVLIDIMLPGIDGFEVCRSVRRSSDVPIVMVTARADTHDVVAGLEAGADDYLPKPFAPKELSARIRALLRRARSTDSGSAHLRFGELEIIPDEGVVRRNGQDVHLTKTEFRLLVELASSPGRVFWALWVALELIRFFLHPLPTNDECKSLACWPLPLHRFLGKRTGRGTAGRLRHSRNFRSSCHTLATCRKNPHVRAPRT
mgnify:CR=1 FL=1